MTTSLTPGQRGDHPSRSRDAAAFDARDLLDNVTEMVVSAAPDWRFIYTNAAFQSTLGYDEDALRDLTVLDIVHPATLPKVREVFARVMNGEDVGVIEAVWVSSTGKAIRVHGTVNCKWHGGQVVATRAIFRDVTDRRRAQAQLHAILDGATDVAIVATNARGVITRFSRGAELLLGYAASDVVQKHTLFLFHDPSEVAAATRESGVVSPGELLAAIAADKGKEWTYVRKDGQRRTVLVSVGALEAPDGTIDGYVTTAHDISERKEVERLKGEFLSIVSHELRTPLTSIRGALGLLASGRIPPGGEAARSMMDVAVSSTDRLVRLINDILDMERIESGSIPMVCAPVEAGDVTNLAVDPLRPLAAAAGVALHVAVPAGLTLLADADRVIQTLTNLIGNAVKFSPAGTTVTVSAKREDGRAVFGVADQGRGIPAEKLESIFNRFSQVDASDAREKGGTGLGLTIARSIVRQHGGRIWVESVVDHGSTFFFSIPLVNPAAEPAPESGLGTPALLLPKGRRSRAAPRAPTILVWDPDVRFMEQLRKSLGERGVVVTTSTSAANTISESGRVAAGATVPEMTADQASADPAAAHSSHRDPARRTPVLVLRSMPPNSVSSRDGIVTWLLAPFDNDGVALALADAATMHLPMKRTRVLIVEDDVELSKVMAATLTARGFHVTEAATGAEAITRVTHDGTDVLLLDLGLPDMSGFDVLEQTRDQIMADGVTTLVYTGSELNAAQRTTLTAAGAIITTKHQFSPERLADSLERLMNADADRPTGASIP